MNLIEGTKADAVPVATQALLPSNASPIRTETALGGLAGPALKAPLKPSGYGLPCAKCKTYYAADLTNCPVCRSAERVSPTLEALPAIEPPALEPSPDPELLEQERERFLQEFKSRLGLESSSIGAEMQITATESFRCSREENHAGSFEPASVCQGCYEHLQERVDQLEAALLLDVKAATQIIYEAVWADPSDPGKTYQNAAHALLNELRTRAGISSVLGSLQPLQH